MIPITVLIVDDHTIMREGLNQLLKRETDICVVSEAKNGREAVAAAKKFSPDVVLMDIAMPNMNGFEAIRQIQKANPGQKVLVLSAHSDYVYIEETIAAGASGYMIKQSSVDMLSKAIRKIHKGGRYFSPAIAKRINDLHASSLDSKGRRIEKKHTLSSRESEVLQLIAEGKANKQVAAELKISIKTVEKHRQHLMDKINIHDTAGLTRYAMAVGAIDKSNSFTPV